MCGETNQKERYYFNPSSKGTCFSEKREKTTSTEVQVLPCAVQQWKIISFFYPPKNVNLKLTNSFQRFNASLKLAMPCFQFNYFHQCNKEDMQSENC